MVSVRTSTKVGGIWPKSEVQGPTEGQRVGVGECVWVWPATLVVVGRESLPCLLGKITVLINVQKSAVLESAWSADTNVVNF